MEQYLKSIYFDPKHPASFSGASKIHNFVKKDGRFKITHSQIKQWLQNQESFSLTKGARRKFRRNRVVVEGLDSQWDGDLMDMSNIAKANGGVRYVLVMIDVFSRFLRCEPLKTKSGDNVLGALKTLFEKGRQPQKIRTDRGTEFTNQKVESYLKERNIFHFITENEVKANYAERVIKSLKSKIYRYVMQEQDHKYVHVLQDLVDSYNRTVHRSLGRAPNDVTSDNEGEVRLQQYLIRQPKQRVTKSVSKYTFKIGDVVRVSHLRGVFVREYQQKWTGEQFKVVQRHMRQALPVYKLEDWSGEKVGGLFYNAELQKIQVDENTVYKIEKVIRYRTRQGHKEALVQWLHWPKKYSSWIPRADILLYKKSIRGK